MVRRNIHSALPLSASRERLLLFLNVLCAAVSAVIIFFAAHSVMCPVKTKWQRNVSSSTEPTVRWTRAKMSWHTEVVLHLCIILPIAVVLLWGNRNTGTFCVFAPNSWWDKEKNYLMDWNKTQNRWRRTYWLLGQMLNSFSLLLTIRDKAFFFSLHCIMHDGLWAKSGLQG